MATWSNMYFQDGNSPLMEQLMFFHDHAMIILIMITMIVSYFMIYLIKNNMSNKMLLHGHTIETIWTILPTITLIFIAFPSIRMLYLIDDNSNMMLTIKTIGRQWYWSYEYSDFINMEFDSFMISNNNIPMNSFRLMEVDNRMMMPMNTAIRIMATASDVIHSWTIPSLGIKIDATPGRLNQSSFNINKPGILFGQCSEICGINHSFMPIMIESTSNNLFMKWMFKLIS
uniref:Cytochrome c oxidase subunit 2 n=1 Tax=Paramastax nigra TaxID=1260743 RepID=M4JDJ6_9ORTH|nr:cytochrome c oxidase subunit II [Paramastax nigra]